MGKSGCFRRKGLEWGREAYNLDPWDKVKIERVELKTLFALFCSNCSTYYNTATFIGVFAGLERYKWHQGKRIQLSKLLGNFSPKPELFSGSFGLGEKLRP